jgi:hypothetical protein
MSGAQSSTDDALAMAWFDSLSPIQGALWLTRAGSDAPASAWAVFRAGLPNTPVSQSPH